MLLKSFDPKLVSSHTLSLYFPSDENYHNAKWSTMPLRKSPRKVLSPCIPHRGIFSLHTSCSVVKWHMADFAVNNSVVSQAKQQEEKRHLTWVWALIWSFINPEMWGMISLLWNALYVVVHDIFATWSGNRCKGRKWKFVIFSGVHRVRGKLCCVVPSRLTFDGWDLTRLRSQKQAQLLSNDIDCGRWSTLRCNRLKWY